jgi:hypothetical protein
MSGGLVPSDQYPLLIFSFVCLFITVIILSLSLSPAQLKVSFCKLYFYWYKKKA